MRERHIERGAGGADFFGGGHNGQRIAGLAGLGLALALGISLTVTFPAEQLAHGVAAGYMPHGAVFLLAGRAHNGAFAVAFNALRRHTHGSAQALGHVNAQRLQRIHHGQQVGLVATGKRIGQHHPDSATQQRCRSDRAEFVVYLFHVREDASDVNHVGVSG